MFCLQMTGSSYRQCHIRLTCIWPVQRKLPPPSPLGMNSLSITFLAISDQYADLFFFFFFPQNGHRSPFWMTEDHFRSHFSPFVINTQLFFKNMFTKWPPAAILDDQKSRSIAFLFSPFQITMQFLFFVSQNGNRRPFG